MDLSQAKVLMWQALPGIGEQGTESHRGPYAPQNSKNHIQSPPNMIEALDSVRRTAFFFLPVENN